MRDLPKKIRRVLREQAMLAHEEELRRALLPLAAAFEEWKAGKTESGELAVRIHDFDRGPSRKLFDKYNSGILNIVVAHAIVTEILDRSQVPSELIEHLSRELEFCQSQETGS